MDDLTTPPTEAEIADVLDALNHAGFRSGALALRRLAFQRDQLQGQASDGKAFRQRNRLLEVALKQANENVQSQQRRIGELQAIVDRLPKTKDWVPVEQTSIGVKVWRTEGPEGLPQMVEYYQNGFAVFRGSVHKEMMRI